MKKVAAARFWFAIQLIQICIATNLLNAQQISTIPNEIIVSPRQFNPKFIKDNKIKNILVVIVDKPDGSVIIDKGEAQGYDFNPDGLLMRYYYTLLMGSEKREEEYPALERNGKVIRAAGTRMITKYLNDTVFVNLMYDSLSRIKCKRVQAADYYDAFYYEYNSKNQLAKQTHCRETNVSENKKVFILGAQSVLSVETFTYEQLIPTQIKKINSNDEGRAFKTTIINTDSSGKVLSENSEYMISWMNRVAEYKYSDKGLLTEKRAKGNESGEQSFKSIYDYDAKGNVLIEKKFKNEEISQEINYLLDEKTNVVKSEAIRNYNPLGVIIVKYGYSYY
jgi:hypothetical protein